MKTQDLAPDSVTFVELANDAVNGPAFLDSAVASNQLADSTQVAATTTVVNANSTGTGIATCPNGGQVLSGGYLAGSGDVVVSSSDDCRAIGVGDPGAGRAQRRQLHHRRELP